MKTRELIIGALFFVAGTGVHEHGWVEELIYGGLFSIALYMVLCPPTDPPPPTPPWPKNYGGKMWP